MQAAERTSCSLRRGALSGLVFFAGIGSMATEVCDQQPHVPFYLATADFFRLCREHPAPDGIIALNISTVPADDRLSRGIAEGQM